MFDVITRKVGNSISFSIPKQFKVPVGKEYIAYQSKNGGLIFSPKISDPFQSTLSLRDDDGDGSEKEWQVILEDEVKYDL